ncbi:hypothetical protein ASC97_07585 [Rhizobium sp. Root1203]|nr:hypothetical protein ASC97_07585 [Rhizobium sp. Root1203]
MKVIFRIAIPKLRVEFGLERHPIRFLILFNSALHEPTWFTFAQKLIAQDGCSSSHFVTLNAI